MNKSRYAAGFITLLAGCIGFANANPIAGAGVEIGGRKSVTITRVHLVSPPWHRTWDIGENWRLYVHLEATLGHWRNHLAGNDTPDITEFALTPVLSLYRRTPSEVMVYFEGGTGAHYLSEKRLSDDIGLGVHFQFGTHLGVGVRFGPRHAYDVAFRVQHISNASIEQPNDGVDLGEIRFTYRW